MKQTILILSMLMVVLCVSAQSKKEMLQTITEQSQTIGELKGKISATEQQLQEANGTISKLQEENASLKRKLESVHAQNNKPMTYRDSLLDLRSKFYACETWQERLQYVMEPERVKPLMEKYYKTNPYSVSLVKNNFNVGITKHQGKSHVLYEVNDNWIVKTDNGYKIDLEATWGDRDVFYGATKEELINNRNKEFEVRGHLRDCQDNYKNDYYFQYYGLWSVFFYIKKNCPVAKKLQNLIPEGERRHLIFKVKYVGKENGDDIFEITDVVCDKLSKY